MGIDIPRQAVPAALARCAEQLDALSHLHRKRQLEPRDGIDFTSNDFLAFSTAGPIRDALRRALEDGVPVGAGASRLLRGNFEQHERLELQAAQFFGTEKALYFATGYIANFALLTCLPKRGDLIAFDALAHASARQGIHASHAKSVKFAHNDSDALERAIRSWRLSGHSQTPWIYVESLYSMDGDRAPLEDLFDIADRYDAMVIVDEAHATGVWGERGGGFAESESKRANLISLHTCGKALGVSGALVCAAREIIDFLISKAAPFIYSTAPSPLMAIAVGEAIRLLADSRAQRERLHALVRAANARAAQLPGIEGSGTQIIPIVIGEDAPALRIARMMREAGFDIRAIRPPTVDSGTARLRLSITLHVDESDIEHMFGCLQPILEKEMP